MKDALNASGSVPRRELVTLLAYLETGSHKAGAHRLGISQATSRQRISALCTRVGARNAAQAIWRLRSELAAEQGEPVGKYVAGQNTRSVLP